MPWGKRGSEVRERLDQARGVPRLGRDQDIEVAGGAGHTVSGHRVRQADLSRAETHHVSTHGRFFSVRAGGGGAAASARVIHRRESAGSITSSIS